MDYENFIHTNYGYCYYTLDYVNLPVIYGLYINQDCRKKGYATHLLTLVIGEIREGGYSGKILIEAKPKENSISVNNLIRFYEQMNLTIL